MAEDRHERPRHPIGVVSQRTGLSTHVLRAWERRYGVVEPGRTEGGQRIYSDADIARLGLLRRATEAGRAIGSVAELSVEELEELVGADRAAQARVAGSGGDAYRERHLALCLEAADRMDARALREEMTRAVVKLSAPVFVTGVVGPLLERVGELWAEGKLRPAQEHVVSTAVRHVLDWLLGRYEAPPGAPVAVVGTPSGELHEFGAMLAAVMAADAGWRVVYLGPSLPAEELAGAAERSGAAVVAVSVVDGEEEDVDRAGREVAALRETLSDDVALVVGGRRSAALPGELGGVTRVGDLAALREVLASIHPARGGAA